MERGQGFLAIASAKADEDPDSGNFEHLWFPELSAPAHQ